MRFGVLQVVVGVFMLPPDGRGTGKELYISAAAETERINRTQGDRFHLAKYQYVYLGSR